MTVSIPVKYADSPVVEHVRLSLDERGLVVIDLPKGREKVSVPATKLHDAMERLFGR